MKAIDEHGTNIEFKTRKGTYRIIDSTLGYDIVKDVVVAGKDGERQGEKMVGHYSTMEGVLTGMLRCKLHDADVKSIKALRATINAVKDEIHGMTALF